jgi:hypothetical protein
MTHKKYKSFSIKVNNIINPINLKNIENTNNDEEDIINKYNPFLIEHVQCYNPIFSLYFPLLKDPDVTFNHHYQFVNMNTICDINGNINNTPVFIKFAPLLDPVRYMIGKYEANVNELRNLPKIALEPKVNDIVIFPKLQSIHNASYVDGFFCFLCSHLLHTYDFLHSIDFYGSYLGIQEKYKMNITDDYEYIKSSDFFNENVNKMFTIFTNNNNMLHDNENNNSQKNKKQLLFEDKEVKELNQILTFDDLTNNLISPSVTENVFLNDTPVLLEKIYEHSISITSNSTSDSSTEHENSDKEEENNDNDSEWETDDESDSNYLTSEDKIIAYMNNFPIQMICLEKCCDTMDSLFMNSEINELIAASALFQIVITLTLYQKIFHFTHNDLHTNNIMYVNTNTEFLYYQYNQQTYKVPTYGKIFKIIDFGRSIYKFQNQILCSDSFGPQGDAHSQYNFEPFFNQSKPRLDPNYSFDLCRLACSIYDFIIDDEDDNLDEFQKTIKKWCTDDNGKNILYKSNGDERYPNFKLYKMISRTVHKCIPSEELNIPLFKNFKYNSKLPKKVNLMNLDAICEYHT